MKTVLLTRSLQDNQTIINTLEQNTLKNCNFKYIPCPLIEHKDLKVTPKVLYNFTNIIITSKYAADIVASWFLQYKKFNISFLLLCDAWVVGASSEAILKKIGFTVKYMAKNIKDLIENLPHELYRRTVHLSSNEITQDLPKEIKRQIIYEVKYVEQLPQAVLKEKSLDYVLLYSQNCAKTFIQLLLKNNLLKAMTSTLAITISSKVADIIRPFVKNVIYCDNDKPEQMLELLIYDAQVKN